MYSGAANASTSRFAPGHAGYRDGMQDRSRFILALVAVLVVVALLVARVGPSDPRSAAAASTIASARVAEDGATVVLTDAEGEMLRALTIEEWRAWAASRSGGLAEAPVRMGEVTLGPDAFDRFVAAVPTPGGEAALAIATAYAMLTSLSHFSLVPVVGEPRRLGPVLMGDVEELAWSPDGAYLAFTVGTAQGAGVDLEVRAGRDGAVVRHVAPDDLLRAAGHAPDENGATGAFLPGFRDLAWSEKGDVLTFRTDLPATQSTGRWRLDVSDGSVTLEEPPDEPPDVAVGREEVTTCAC